MKAMMRVSVGAVCLFLILGLVWTPPVQAASFGGRAFSALVNVPTLGTGPLYFSDTGRLDSIGGWEGAALHGVNVPNVLAADVLVAATSGGQYDAGDAAHSSTSLGDVIVFPGQLAQLTASFVRSQMDATAAGLQGSSEVADLTFAGVPITVTGEPNQKVEVFGIGTLIINEQAMTADAGSQMGTVNALHLILSTGEEVILSSARSSITR